MRRYLFLFLCLFLFFSCKNKEEQRISNLVKEWSDKEILFTPELHFSSLGKNVPSLLEKKWDYAIVSYTDSIGCTSCKLQLQKWKKLISQKDSIFEKEVEVLLFLHSSERKELLFLLKDYKFDYPVCIDDNDIFNKLNRLPKDIAFQTFLIDKDNKILAIGNPIHNDRIKKLYLNIIQDKEIEVSNSKNATQTAVTLDKTILFLGNFDWQKEQKATFVLKNAGNKPLVIEDVNTSCGCTSVDYSKEPVRPGGEIRLEVIYKADHPEYFNKTITVYCNSESSPIKLTISGDAQ